MERFLERHAQLFLWAIGIALIFVLMIIATRNGVLGEPPQNSILAIEAAIGKFISDYEKPLEYSAKVLGALGTLATAIIGIVKGIHYAEKRLPQRLVDFVTRIVKAVEGHAAAIVSAVAQPSANVKLGTALFYVAPLNSALDAIGSPSTKTSRRTFDDTITEIDRNIGLAEIHLTKLQALKANAHLVRGAIETANASYDSKDVTASEKGHANAELDFEAAAGNGSTKVHALELRGLLRTRRGNFAGALTDFTAMAEAAVDPCSLARAQRYQAETQMKQSNGTNGRKLKDARSNLNAGFKALKTDKTQALPERAELARNRLAYAELQGHLSGKGDLVTKTLREALAFLKENDPHPARELRQTIEARLKPINHA